MVVFREVVDRRHVAPEQAAVVDDPGDHPDPVVGGRVEDELAGPGLERVQDHHRPVDPLPEALEAVEQVEGEAVRRPGSDPDRRRQALVAKRGHPVPDDLGCVAGVIGVVEEQHVEAIAADPLQAALGRHPQVGTVGARIAEAGIGEPGEPAGAVALALVEVVADRADEAVIAARHARERPAEQPIGLALAVGVGGEQGRDAGAGLEQLLEALLAELLAEAQEPAAAPGAERDPPGVAAVVVESRHRPER